eukprot:gene19077-biopygen5841
MSRGGCSRSFNFSFNSGHEHPPGDMSSSQTGHCYSGIDETNFVSFVGTPQCMSARCFLAGERNSPWRGPFMSPARKHQMISNELYQIPSLIAVVALQPTLIDFQAQ